MAHPAPTFFGCDRGNVGEFPGKCRQPGNGEIPWGYFLGNPWEFPGKLDERPENFPGGESMRIQLPGEFRGKSSSRETPGVSREIGSRAIPREFSRELGCASAAFPGEFPRPLGAASNFPGNSPGGSPGHRGRQPDFAHFSHSEVVLLIGKLEKRNCRPFGRSPDRRA